MAGSVSASLLESICGPGGVLPAGHLLFDGPQPAFLVSPRDEAEASAVLALASQQRWAVVLRGGGTKDRLGAPLRQADLVLSTLQLSQVVEYEPADLTVTVQAGMRMEALQQLLAAQGQRLPLDAPEGATVGGVVASACAGALRYRFGGPREMVLGLRMALTGGQVIACGARVVKNVAGYDLNKLFTGSMGTLGLITQVTFKVMPVPSVSRTFYFRAPLSAARSVVDSELEPESVDWCSETGLLSVGVAGEAAAVMYHEERLRQLLRAFPVRVDTGAPAGAEHSGDAIRWNRPGEPPGRGPGEALGGSQGLGTGPRVRQDSEVVAGLRDSQGAGVGAVPGDSHGPEAVPALSGSQGAGIAAGPSGNQDPEAGAAVGGSQGAGVVAESGDSHGPEAVAELGGSQGAGTGAGPGGALELPRGPQAPDGGGAITWYGTHPSGGSGLEESKPRQSGLSSFAQAGPSPIRAISWEGAPPPEGAADLRGVPAWEGAPAHAALQATLPPASLEPFCAEVWRLFPGARVRASLSGVAEISLTDPTVLELAERICTLDEAASSLGGHLRVVDAPAAVKSAVRVWGAPGPGFPLMEALKRQFDPAGILNPGRFVGGL